MNNLLDDILKQLNICINYTYENSNGYLWRELCSIEEKLKLLKKKYNNKFNKEEYIKNLKKIIGEIPNYETIKNLSFDKNGRCNIKNSKYYGMHIESIIYPMFR